MDHGWTTDGGPQDEGDPDLDRDVFRRVFGYLPAPGVKVAGFSSDWDMATAVLSLVREAWRPLSIEVRQRPTTDPGLVWEANPRIPGAPPRIRAWYELCRLALSRRPQESWLLSVSL
jgi:hypothetical protein